MRYGAFHVVCSTNTKQFQKTRKYPVQNSSQPCMEDQIRNLLAYLKAALQKSGLASLRFPHTTTCQRKSRKLNNASLPFFTSCVFGLNTMTYTVMMLTLNNHEGYYYPTATQSRPGVLVLLIAHDHNELQRNSIVQFALNIIATLVPTRTEEGTASYKILCLLQDFIIF